MGGLAPQPLMPRPLRSRSTRATRRRERSSSRIAGAGRSTLVSSNCGSLRAGAPSRGVPLSPKAYSASMFGRTVAGLVAASLIVTVMIGAGGSPAHAAGVEVTPYSWDVAGIGASGRTLRLLYTSKGDCNDTFLATQSRVVENAMAVRIELFEVFETPPPGTPRLACAASLGPPRAAYVTLSVPLAGRSIKGRIPGLPFAVGPPVQPPDRPGVAIRVPRVVGFSVWEARRIIWRSGLNVQIRRSTRSVARTQVVAQTPAGPLAPRDAVGLHVAVAH